MDKKRFAVAIGASCLLISALAAPIQGTRQPFHAGVVSKADLQPLIQSVALLDAFDSRVNTLVRRGKPTASEIDALAAESAAVKRSFGDASQSIRTFVAKLRAANKWTPELDAHVDARLRAAGAVALADGLKAEGGARAVVEKTAALQGAAAAEIDKELAALRGRSIARRLFEELTGTPVSAGLFSLACNYFKVAAIGCAVMEDLECLATNTKKYKDCLVLAT